MSLVNKNENGDLVIETSMVPYLRMIEAEIGVDYTTRQNKAAKILNLLYDVGWRPPHIQPVDEKEEND